MKYTLTYDLEDLATVEITDAAKAAPYIKEMVEFWMNWEDDLKRNKGDYLVTFLKRLARYILLNEEEPTNREGWYPLDGTLGIKVTDIVPFEWMDEDLIEITDV